MKLCKRFGRDASKQQRIDAHKIKMQAKQLIRDSYDAGRHIILANISVNHQDYGMSPAEHEAAKAERKK